MEECHSRGWPNLLLQREDWRDPVGETAGHALASWRVIAGNTKTVSKNAPASLSELFDVLRALPCPALRLSALDDLLCADLSDLNCCYDDAADACMRLLTCKIALF